MNRVLATLSCVFAATQAAGSATVAQGTSVLALVSEATKHADLGTLEELKGRALQLTVLDAADLSIEVLSAPPTLILDFLNSESLSLSHRLTLPATTRWVNCNHYDFRGEETLYPSDLRELADIAKVAVELGIDDICVFLTPESAAGNFDEAESALGLNLVKIVLTEDLEYESLKLLLRKEVKNKSLLHYVILLPAASTLTLLRAMQEINLHKAPITFLWSQISAAVRGYKEFPAFAQSGPIFLASPGCETTITPSDYLYCRLAVLTSKDYSPAVRSVVMLQNRTEVVIGELRGSVVRLCENCFSLLQKQGAAAARIPLQISFNNGTENPSGNTNTGEREWYLGAQLALLDINNSTKILPAHSLVIFNVSLGMSVYNFTWMWKRLTKFTREDFGLAFMHSQYSAVAVPLYDVFAANLSWALPQVGSAILTPMISSPITHPYMSRVVVSTDYFAVLYVNMLKRYKWKRIALFYCDDLFCRDLYGTFRVVAQEANIEIVNPEEHRKFPSNMNEYPTDKVPIYQQIIDSKVKIVFMMLYGTSMYYSLEVFYDLGMRRGDLFFLATTWLVPSVFTAGEEQSIAKRKELLHGALQFYPVSYYGPLGKDVKKRYKETFGVTPANKACLYYDALMSIAHALDYLIARGEQYELPNVMAKQLKRVRFIGCSGEVSMQDGSNDRSPMIFQILNAVVKYDGSVDVREVGVYDPTGLVLFNFSIPITWPDNSTVTPLDTRYNTIDCPFEEEQIVTFLPGALLAYGVLLNISLVCAVVTAVIWRKYWRQHAQPLLSKCEISFDDYILFLTIALEALQYAGMGPPLPSSVWFVSMASDSLSWKLENFVNFKQGMFWMVLNGVLASVVAWILFLIIAKMQATALRAVLCSFLIDVAEKALPILGNLCFLPITSMLLNVFLCTEAVDSGGSVGFTNTFLRKDCYQYCWVMPHLMYAIATIVAVCLYVPSAVYLRPTWQNTQPSLHVHTSPSFLMIKTIYQISVIMSRKILAEMSVLAHAVVYFTVTAVFFGFTWRWRPYGYSRANLWHAVSMICVLWLALITLLDICIPALPDTAVVLSIVIGAISFALVGFIWQCLRLPALLYRPKGVHVVDLFKFQFSRGNRFLYLFSKEQPAANDDNSERHLADPSPRPNVVYPTFSPGGNEVNR